MTSIPLETPRTPPTTATGKQEPWRDGQKQYRFTAFKKAFDGEETLVGLRSYTRSTTIADTLEDKLGLHKWDMRMLAKGLAHSPDLLKLAKGHDPDEDYATFEKIVTTALNRAKTDEAANEGTALHRFTELYDLGQTTIAAYPPDVRAHIRSYAKQLAQSGFEVVPELVEQIVIDDNYTFGGQLDRVLRATRDIEATLPRLVTADNPHGIFTIPKGTLIVGDLKTGKLKLYKHIEFGTQITGYANHTATWDVDHNHEHGGTRGERVDVSRDVALIIHLPATDPNAPCSLHWVDLGLGLEYFQSSIEVRGLRSAPYKRMLITEYKPPEPNNEAVSEWLRDRLDALSPNQIATQTVKRQWPNELRDNTGQPIRLPADPSTEQVDALAAVLDRVEADHELPFRPKRPEGQATNNNQTRKQADTP